MGTAYSTRDYVTETGGWGVYRGYSQRLLRKLYVWYVTSAIQQPTPNVEE